VSIALATPDVRVRELFVAESVSGTMGELLAAAVQRDVHVTWVGERAVAALAETETPQGVFAVVDLPAPDARSVLAGARDVAVLVAVADPGNVGTIIRSADAAGADAVVLTAGCADAYGGKAARASAGSVLRIPLLTGVEVEAAVPLLHEYGLTVVATSLDGVALDPAALRALPRVAWLFGSEAHGLPEVVRSSADHHVRLPMRAGVESLNVTAAAAVCLFLRVLA
jgi:TrmH family RNA methyltransferase